MNMMTPETLKDLTEGAEVAENPALAKLMKAWESKNAQRAAKGSGLTLMAVSLGACGGGGGGGVAPPPPPPTGQTFTLTLGDDNFTGDVEADTFNAPLASTIGGIVSAQTLQQTDVLDGGDGVDTLNAVLNGTGAPAGLFGLASPSITNIEIFNLTAGGAPGGLDLINSSGYQQLWNINSNNNLTVVNVREGATIGLNGTAGNTTYTVMYTSAAAADIVNQVVVANSVGGSTLSGQFTTLDIRDAAANAGIADLTLIVSNGVRMILDNSAANIRDLTIQGNGPLVLGAVGNFPNLVNFNSAGYAPNLTLDVSGSGSIESFVTGAGDDVITMAAATFSADTPATSLNLGAGDNRLILVDTVQTNPPGTYTGGGIIDSAELSALDFTFGTVSNVQTLELRAISLDANASLALEGVGGLETLALRDFNNAGGWDLTITGAPATLMITENPEIEMNGGLFTIEGAVDLTVQTTFAGDSDIRFDGGFNSNTVETLVINASDDAEFLSDGGSDALRTLEVNAAGSDVGDAVVELDNTATGDEFGALESVVVTAAENATLAMAGLEPIFQEQIFRIGTTGNPAAQDHNYSFAYEDENGLPQVLVVNLPGVPQVGGSQQIATAIAAAFDALPEFNAFPEQFSGLTWQAVVIRVDAGGFTPIDAEQTAGTRSLTQELIEGVEGAGFETLEQVVVDAGENAGVQLVDVYGAFSVDVMAGGSAQVIVARANATEVNVSAGENAFVVLSQTAATSLSVNFGTEVVYTTDMMGNITGFDAGTNGAIIGVIDGNPLLESIQISGAVAGGFFPVVLAGDLTSLQTVDLTGVTEWFIVNAEDAEFTPAAGQYVTYLFGATSSDWDLGFSGVVAAEAREAFTFTDADFGTIVIQGFTAGADPAIGDRIDLSQLGFTNNGQLVFEQGTFDFTTGEFTDNPAGLHVRITDLAGGPTMNGEIIVVGADVFVDLIDANDLQAFNMLYA